jgi:hypothetical protein
MQLERITGIAVIIVATFILYLISVLDPPTLVQIGAAVIGSIIYLMGVVISFAEDPILFKKRKSAAAEKASQVGGTLRDTAS